MSDDTMAGGPLALRRLQERFLQLDDAKQVKPLVKAAENAVVTWRAATDRMLSPEPFYKERYRGGRWAREGETLSHPTDHGFDAAGNPVFIKDYYPTLLLYSPGFIEEIRHYERQHTISYLSHFYFDARGRLVRQLEATSLRLSDTTFTWEGDRLVHSEEQEIREDWTEVEDPLAGPVQLQPYITRVYDYGTDGKIERITLKGLSDRDEIEYQRPQKRQSAASVSKELEEELLRIIPLALQAAAIPDPLYCVFLTYCSSGWNLLPVLCLASVKDRELCDYGDGDFDTESMWLTSELKHGLWIDLPDDGLSERWSLFYQLMGAAEDFGTCPKMLRRVAKRLNEQDWTGTLPVTDDFIFTASDTSDRYDTRDDLPPSVPAKRLALLKKRGLWE